ncbi:hypothetical protein SUDANB120_06168 (plasmid) [Streptomyces sp. enrichment culture]|uniref:hypothetical protein n=1 Tax=Streptomyces sp. enrichment culture TaxID=1795815 RepID=UPI003F55AEF8
MDSTEIPAVRDGMGRDNALRRQWSPLASRPIRQAASLTRLWGFRRDGVRAAASLARRNSRMLKVVRYVQAPEREAGAQFEELELVARSRHYLVVDELCLDVGGPMLLEYRSGLRAARRLLRGGFADGLLAPTYEHLSPNVAEYERLLRDLHAHGYFVALAESETGR